MKHPTTMAIATTGRVKNRWIPSTGSSSAASKTIDMGNAKMFTPSVWRTIAHHVCNAAMCRVLRVVTPCTVRRHPFISLNAVKVLRIALLGASLLALAACGDVQVSSTSTEVGVSDTTTPVDSPSDDATLTTTTEPVPTTSVEATTTTTVPVTTTTVLDVACIKTTTCQFANLVGVDFSRLKLDFVNFQVASLAGASFVGANLNNSIFIRADLTAVNFEGASLKNVDFTAATLTAASFKGANVEGAVLCDVDLTGVLDLTKAQLDQVKKFKTKGKVYCP